jgi:hypothetical protein
VAAYSTPWPSCERPRTRTIRHIAGSIGNQDRQSATKTLSARQFAEGCRADFRLETKIRRFPANGVGGEGKIKEIKTPIGETQDRMVGAP